MLAHEAVACQDRDILISSVAATIGAVITWIAHIAAFASMTDDDDGGNPLGGILMLILAPLAAGLIQMAISRSREFGADSTGARLTHDPRALASALRKIEAYSRGTPPATTVHRPPCSSPTRSRAGSASAACSSTHPEHRRAGRAAGAHGLRRLIAGRADGPEDRPQHEHGRAGQQRRRGQAGRQQQAAGQPGPGLPTRPAPLAQAEIQAAALATA